MRSIKLQKEMTEGKTIIISFTNLLGWFDSQYRLNSIEDYLLHKSTEIFNWEKELQLEIRQDLNL